MAESSAQSVSAAHVKAPPSAGELIPDAKHMRIAIVHTEWNTSIITALLEGAIGELRRNGVHRENIEVFRVPGAFELPFAAKRIIHKRNVNAVITLGCLIKGETMHFEYICEAVSRGIMELNVRSNFEIPHLDVPVIFGVLTVLNEDQARARAGLIPGSHNHGVEWAATALKMALLSQSVGF